MFGVSIVLLNVAYSLCFIFIADGSWYGLEADNWRKLYLFKLVSFLVELQKTWMDLGVLSNELHLPVVFLFFQSTHDVVQLTYFLVQLLCTSSTHVSRDVQVRVTSQTQLTMQHWISVVYWLWSSPVRSSLGTRASIALAFSSAASSCCFLMSSAAFCMISCCHNTNTHLQAYTRHRSLSISEQRLEPRRCCMEECRRVVLVVWHGSNCPMHCSVSLNSELDDTETWSVAYLE